MVDCHALANGYAGRVPSKETAMNRPATGFFNPAIPAAIAVITASAASWLLAGCSVTSHATQPAGMGVSRSSAALLAVVDTPGPVELETVVAADWVVPRSGLINLDHPRARAAGLDDGDEPIHLYVHVLRHPEHGTFLVDSGVERALHAEPERAAVRGLLARVMDIERIRVHVDTATLLGRQPGPIAGVLLTHLHLDHILGLPDVPRGTPIYAGPGETRPRSIEHLFTRGTTGRALAGHASVHEWQFEADPDGRFDGVLDVFGDGSVWALHVPGHSPGSTAYLVRTTGGPVLLVGDACHTAWGWEQSVEPGTFSLDQPRSARSLERLQRWVAEHPGIEVRLGHQVAHRDASGPAARTAALPGTR
jgi:N-acyl homoserine lactone hydrolase